MKKGKFKHKGLKITLISIGSLIGVAAITVGSLLAYGTFMTYPKPVDKIENKTGLVQAYKNGLYDKNGNLLILKGINAGNLFVQEGWLSPFAIEPNKNEDGSYKKDNDNNLTYPEFAQETFLSGLLKNPNCGKEKLDEWLDYYYNAWWNDVDFVNCKEIGFNTIRLPVYYRQFLNDDLSLKTEEEAFKHIDKFIEGAKKHDLYIVLDLHGVPGSQNGYEHSGTLIKEANFWDNETYIQSVINLWDKVSEHYMKNEALGSQIVAYDLMNEPTSPAGAYTEKNCHDVFDRIYDVIRENNDQHVISMEGSWGFNKLPNPKDYGWENVLYQYHFYNWLHESLPYSLYNVYNSLLNIGRWYEVPTLIGEFSFFHNKDYWMNGLEHYDKNYFSWTIWTYKTTVIGDWDNSWGLYNVRLNLNKDQEETKCNVEKCDFETFKSFCDKCKTTSSYCKSGFLKETITEYYKK